MDAMTDSAYRVRSGDAFTPPPCRARADSGRRADRPVLHGRSRRGDRGRREAGLPRRRRGPYAIGEDAELYPFCTVGLAPQDMKYKGEPTRCEIGARTWCGSIARSTAALRPERGSPASARTAC